MIGHVQINDEKFVRELRTIAEERLKELPHPAKATLGEAEAAYQLARLVSMLAHPLVGGIMITPLVEGEEDGYGD